VKIAALRNAALEDGQDATLRLWKQARATCEDVMDQFVHDLVRQVKRRPIQSLAVAVGVGALFGLAISASRR
jgi:hypothetical protein